MSGVWIVHADESCLGNQNEGASRGGAGALIESRDGDTVTRHDLYLSDPNTTNNQMALRGARAVLDALRAEGPGHPIAYFSDSQYLVKGITDWVHRWERAGWRRRGGPVENLALWQALREADRGADVTWRWVRGHDGHVKNEYADYVAVRAAEAQHDSDGLAPSGFGAWLDREQAAGRYRTYDPNRDFRELEERYRTA